MTRLSPSKSTDLLAVLLTRAGTTLRRVACVRDAGTGRERENLDRLDVELELPHRRHHRDFPWTRSAARTPASAASPTPTLPRNTSSATSSAVSRAAGVNGRFLVCESTHVASQSRFFPMVTSFACDAKVPRIDA